MITVYVGVTIWLITQIYLIYKSVYKIKCRICATFHSIDSNKTKLTA